jgi:ABC-type lipoprotein export system ATPase subunit
MNSINLEHWREYIHHEDFDTLLNFLNRTNVEEKLDKILVLEGCGGNGRSTFINEISNIIDVKTLPLNINIAKADDVSDTQRCSPELAHVMEDVKLISLRTEYGFEEYDKMIHNIKLLLTNPELKYRALYCKAKIGKIKGNFIMCSCPNYFPAEFVDSLLIIRFVHKFV